MLESINLMVVGGVIAAAVATVLVLKSQIEKKNESSAQSKIDESVAEAKSRLDREIQSAKSRADEEGRKVRQELESEYRDRKKELEKAEDHLMQKEKHLDSRESYLAEREETLTHDIEKVKRIKEKHEETIEKMIRTLESSAQLSQEEAKEILMTNVERTIRQQAGVMIKKIEDQAKKVANRKAKEIIVSSIHRTAVDHVTEATTSAVALPDDDMKGRIIGKEGRNIRAFEYATGVDVIIDDTPGAVILSSFDPIRREIAKMAMQILLKDGRIHPTRVEEAVEKAREQLDEIIKENGEKAIERLGIDIHPKLVELLGRLQYRTSYGQNMLQHALETAMLAGGLAQELGVNVNLAKRGGLLHDIGKALDFETQGTHVDIGDEVCRKYGESEEVINCINAHHEDEEPETIEAVIVTVADAMSSARPGARKESVEAYVKRLEKLENLAASYEGVDKAYAIQAGREIRVLVRPDDIDDPGTKKLALDMAKRIESELEYPGEIKVSVIRETRSSSIAH